MAIHSNAAKYESISVSLNVGTKQMFLLTSNPGVIAGLGTEAPSALMESSGAATGAGVTLGEGPKGSAFWQHAVGVTRSHVLAV